MHSVASIEQVMLAVDALPIQVASVASVPVRPALTLRRSASGEVGPGEESASARPADLADAGALRGRGIQ